MELMIPLKSGKAISMYEQIYAYIKEEIRQGAMEAGMRLPSTRVLAENLNVSRSTTQMAYDQLVAEGYVEALPNRGYFVLGMEALFEAEQEPPGTFIPKKEGEKSGTEIDFSPRGIDLTHFPYNVWRKLTRNTLVEDNKEMFLTGSPQGEPALREAIKGYLHSARGVRCAGEQIIIGAGNEYLLMLLYQILGTERVIAMENPTYKQAYRVFESLGYGIVPVGMDGLGMDIRALRNSRADIAYVMPSHQYPTGIVMPVGRRQELLKWAGEKKGRYLIEDDYDSEFRYKGRPIPALQGLDKAGKVIYMGTFSKSIAPAIRVGYMVLPRPLLEIYRERLGFYASTVSRIDQNVIYQFLTDGYYERHLNRMRAIYKGKHDLLLGQLRKLEDDFEICGEHAGLHILLANKKGRTEKWLVERAGEKGAKVYGLSSYFISRPCDSRPGTVLLGYARLSEEEILKGAELLQEAWKEK
ncbi:MAG: PLP-dependent aminotransferase family protein [Hungatella sp.]|nr:PLP-dependent aminotransferase family protein [Hungatella sp.]